MNKPFSSNTPSWRCPNCDGACELNYCPSCGQSRKDWDISLGTWLKTNGREILDIDGRLLASLRTLFTSPGQLTLDWLEGRHASRSRPLRLYLLASALFFGVLALPGTDFGTDAFEGAIDGYVEAGEPGESPRLATLADDEAALRRMAEAVSNNMPRAMFLLLPLVAGLVGLVGWVIRNPSHHYVAHLVWALHAHSVTFLVLLAWFPLTYLRGPAKFSVAYPIVGLSILWLAWYWVKALSRAYECSMPRAFMSLAAVGVVYTPVLILVVVAISALSLG
jgi:hypothetical protein